MAFARTSISGEAGVGEAGGPMDGPTGGLMGGLSGAVPRQSVRDVVAEKIAAAIASGVLSVGDELPGERDLAASLAVSRETVRGAIGILAAHGVLRVSQGARTTVADADLSRLALREAPPAFAGRHDLRSVHEARLLIEGEIARKAARLATPALIEALDLAIAAQEACAGDPVRFLMCDREFHDLLYRASGNDLLADMAMSLYGHLLDHRRRIVSRPGAIAVSIADHRDIADALRWRDSEAAVAAVSRHATRIHDTTRAFLDRQGR